MNVSKIRLNKKLVCFGGESESESVRSRDERSLTSPRFILFYLLSLFLTLDDGALILLQLFDIN